MAYNKVTFDGNTIIDLSGDTVTSADVANGKTFHLANGEQTTGTAEGAPLQPTFTFVNNTSGSLRVSGGAQNYTEMDFR